MKATRFLTNPIGNGHLVRTLAWKVAGLTLLISAMASVGYAQNKTYTFRGTLPPGSSSHSEVADGETFVATFIVNVGVADTNPASYAGNYPAASIVGTLRFSGGYLATSSFLNSDVVTNNNFPYSVPPDVVRVTGSDITVTAYTIDNTVLTTDALPNDCESFSSSTTTGFAPIMLSYSDAGGSIQYDAADADNVSFAVTDVDTWTDSAGGFFNVGSNWFDGSAPTECEQAVFNVDALYDVDWNSSTNNRTNLSLSVRDGDVLFKTIGSGSGGPTYQYELLTEVEIEGDSIVGVGDGFEKHRLKVGTNLWLNDGALNINSGSTLDVNGSVFCGDTDSAGTILAMNGATVSGGGLMVAEKGTTTVVASGGAVVDWFAVECAGNSDALGGITVTGTGTIWNTEFGLDIGTRGIGIMTIENGGQVNNQLSKIGDIADGDGDVTVSGIGSRWNLETLLDIGFTDNAQGSLTIEDGGVVSCSAGGIRLAPFSTNPNSRVVISGTGSQMNAESDILVGVAAHAQITITDGGSLATNSELQIYEDSSIDMNGTSAELMTTDGLVVEGTLRLSTNESAFVFGDVRSASAGSVRVSFGSEATINGSFINDGTEFFISGSSECNIDETFSGAAATTGTGKLNLRADVEPGIDDGIDDVGTMEIECDVALFDTSTTQIELNNSTFDRIEIAGNLELDGELNVYDVGIELTPGEQFVFIDVSGTRTGEFIGLPEGAIVRTMDGLELLITYTAGDGNDVALYTVGDVVTATPDSFTVTRGNLVSGGVPELAASDNGDLSARRGSSDVQSRVFVEFKSTSSIASPSALEFALESSVFARSNVVQSIDLYNYDLDAWEEVDVRSAARFSDSTAIVTPGGDVSRFVQPGTLCIEARVRYLSDNPRQQFSANMDQVIWTITP